MSKPVTTITAHSGCEGTPVDSLESIRVAIALGADIAELDVRFDTRLALVISHDKRKDYTGCFLLREALEMVRESPATAINCDIKEAETVPAVLALADEIGLGPDKLAFSGSLSPLMLKENPEITKRAAVYLNVEEILRELYFDKLSPAEQEAVKGNSLWKVIRERMAEIRGFAPEIASLCRDLGVRALNFPHLLCREPVFEALWEQKTPFAIWTVNDPGEMLILLEEKVRNITTKEVKSALALRKEMYRGN